MPKKARRAHVPQQVVRKRKPTRRSEPLTPGVDEEPESEPTFADPPAFVHPSAQSGPVDTRPHRRLELLTRAREQTVVRVIPGQLPTFERAYLVNELRRITMTAGVLLAIIILLAIILR